MGVGGFGRGEAGPGPRSPAQGHGRMGKSLPLGAIAVASNRADLSQGGWALRHPQNPTNFRSGGAGTDINFLSPTQTVDLEN